MVLLCCAKLPISLDAKQLAAMAKNRLGNGKNDQYLDDIERRRNSESVRESLGALVTLAVLLDKLGLSESEIRSLSLVRNDNGKPYFENSTISFSISHSQEYVACAVSDESCIGIDIEASNLNCERARKIASRFFGEDEIADMTDNASGFRRVWTKKEAATKLLGITLGEYLKSEKNDMGNVKSSLNFFEFEIDGYPVTLCTDKIPSTIKRIEIDLDEIGRK